MIKECVVHVGMNKTGSSSIQETLSKIELKETQYLNLGPSNHSGVFATLFSDNPESYHGNVKHGRSKSDVHELREKLKTRLSAELKRAQTHRVMVSAEDLSFPDDRRKLERLKDFFLDYCSNIKIIGYVRPPSAFIHSAFQQRVKGGMGHFNIKGCYPRYRNRFEQIDQVFGEDNVTLRKFCPNTLFGGNVVTDIAEYLGESVDEKDIVKVNESISVEALSALYLYRKFGPEYGKYKNAPKDNENLICFLSQFGRSKLRLSESIINPILLDQSKDIEWIEKRLEADLNECINKRHFNEVIVSSEQELVEMGGANLVKNLDKVAGSLLSKRSLDTSVSVAVMDLIKRL